MSFQQDTAFADEIGQSYGNYYSTFLNEAGQVVAQIFERNGRLVAHVSFPPDVKPEDVIDVYWNELHRYAKEHGFEGKLRVIYSN